MYATRVEEIREAIMEAKLTIPAVPVVPVRMQEAWLLIDERAIREAAGNPHGRYPLALPALHELEDLPDAKARLHILLRDASGLHGRRLRTAPITHYAQQVTKRIEDFTALRRLSAFADLEARLARLVHERGWTG
jgi:hypothetical protein